MGMRPLDDPRLQAVEAALNDGSLDRAQELLAALDLAGSHRQGLSYLTTRLLFQRGRLSVNEVSSRMQQVLQSTDDFPQARALLNAAEQGTLSPKSPTPSTNAQTASVPIPGPPALPTFGRNDPELPTPSLGAPSLELDLEPELGEAPEFSGPPTILDPPRSLHHTQAAHQSPVPSGARSSSPPIHDLTLEMEEFEFSQDEDVTRPFRDRASTVDLERDTSPDGSSWLETTSHHETPSDAPEQAPPSTGSLPPNQTPTMFSVLTLLDERRYSEALAMISENKNSASPELTLMRARAYLGLGSNEAARDSLEPLCTSTAIGPELRAGCARLLLEADEPEQALEQAELARERAPDSPGVLLTSAWALVRVARRDQDAEKRTLASRLLARLGGGGGPTPTLALALGACLAAEGNSPELALESAEHALELETGCIDALVAKATAEATLGHLADAAATWRKLLAAHHPEAMVLRPHLSRLGAELERVSPSLAPGGPAPVSRRIWDPLESAMVSGEHEALIDAWNADCEPILARLDADPSELGRLAGRALTGAPGFCHFAPYDLSLWSLLRLQVALDLVFGTAPIAPDVLEGRLGSQLVLSAYVGETIRFAFQGEWTGRLSDPHQALVRTASAAFLPFEAVHSRLQNGGSLGLDDLVPLESAHWAVPHWARRAPDDALPPTPWAPDPWPSIEQVGSLGRALSRSVVAMYCEQFAFTSLDHSLGCLPALDSYLTLIGPPGAPPAEASPALVRSAILVGAYVGEVVRSHWGGRWVRGDAPDASAYVLELGSVTARPVHHTLSRSCGLSSMTLTEYVDRLAGQLGR